MKDNISIKWLQEYIKKKDYNPELKQGYFLKMVEEMGELSEVIRKDRRLCTTGDIKGTIEEELYDVMYYVVALANIYNIDLEECFWLKEAINDRKYRDKQLYEWNNMFLSNGQKKPKVDDWLDKFRYILDQSNETPVIDLGCGFGNDTLYLSERDFKVISCDYSEEALKRLNCFILNPDTRLFNMLDGLPFPDSVAKVIIADLSLHYFSSEDTCKIIKDISRVLVDEGYLICRVNSIYLLFERFGSIDGWSAFEVFLCFAVIGASFAISTCLARGFDSFPNMVKNAGTKEET